MNQEPFILCDNLVKIHRIADVELVALQGLDLVVMQGELLGIVGPSGSGKTTLMNILGGLDRPTAGRVWVDGQNLLKLSQLGLDEYRRRRVGFVWQQSARNLVPYLSAWDNIEMPMTMAGASWNKRRQRTRELLEIVGLADRRQSRLDQLSGGEQQRIAIAVALANQPRLLLADEPTGEVDSTTAQLIYKTLQDINAQMGLTILIVSHDPEIARQVHRVVAIRDGKTSSETVRQSKTNGNSPELSLADTTDDMGVTQDEDLLEYILLDSAGRLQLPKEYLQHFAIKGRVTAELAQEGILIRPALEAGQVHAVESLVTQLEHTKKSGWIKTFAGRLARIVKGHS
ncbi:MAG: ABC transporter ATP-binding protein [Omnitrophica WOR_2 bacterium]